MSITCKRFQIPIVCSLVRQSPQTTIIERIRRLSLGIVAIIRIFRYPSPPARHVLSYPQASGYLTLLRIRRRLPLVCNYWFAINGDCLRNQLSAQPSETKREIARKWEGRQESENVADRPGRSLQSIAIAIGGIGLLLLILIAFYFGIDPKPLMDQMGKQVPAPQNRQDPGSETVDDEAKKFISVI